MRISRRQRSRNNTWQESAQNKQRREWGEIGKSCLFIKHLKQPLFTKVLYEWFKNITDKERRAVRQKDHLHNHAYANTHIHTEKAKANRIGLWDEIWMSRWSVQNWYNERGCSSCLATRKLKSRLWSSQEPHVWWPESSTGQMGSKQTEI